MSTILDMDLCFMRIPPPKKNQFGPRPPTSLTRPCAAEFFFLWNVDEYHKDLYFQILVSDPSDNKIYLYTLEGKCYCCFTPHSHTGGLALTVGDACFTPLGQILLVDTLNHVINLYTDRGEFLQQVKLFGYTAQCNIHCAWEPLVIIQTQMHWILGARKRKFIFLESCVLWLHHRN